MKKSKKKKKERMVITLLYLYAAVFIMGIYKEGMRKTLG